MPSVIPDNRSYSSKPITTREAFLADVEDGMKAAPMSVRLTPHIVSVANWASPFDDPVIRQFVPLKSKLVPDHPRLTLDSLHEEGDSPVPGLVHRYPDKVLFLGQPCQEYTCACFASLANHFAATSVCPVYCRFCTRSYAVGAPTDTVKKSSIKPTLRRWNKMFEYIEATPQINDVVVSGGDSYYLNPEHLTLIGERLLNIPHVRRFRFATKGLAVCPMRITDTSDGWIDSFIALSDRGKEMGKQVAMHTHFNHPNEITFATRLAAASLFRRGVMVRNQSVLLRGVNDNVATMSKLIRSLADLNIHPYYVYQSDMVKGVEDMRTPLSTILDLEKQIRGTIAGFMMPSFVVDLPGGGGKRLASSYESYDEKTGVSTFRAPGVSVDKEFTYHDPLPQCR